MWQLCVVNWAPQRVCTPKVAVACARVSVTDLRGQDLRALVRGSVGGLGGGGAGGKDTESADVAMTNQS